MRRVSTAIAGVALGALALAACSGGSGDGASSDNGATGGGDTSSLTVWIMGDSSAKFDELVTPFEEQTGHDVNVVAIPWDSVDERLTTAVASDDGPDLMQIGLSKLRTYADAGALLPLDEHLADYPALAPDNFPEGISGDALKINGETLSVPWVSDTRVLFYRSDILADAGIEEPPATWEQLRADAKVLSERGSGQYGYYIPQWDSALPVIMTWAHGGDIVDDAGVIDFTTPEFDAAVDLYAGLYADGSVPTNADFDQAQGFISGIAPMLISGPYLAATIADAAPELDGAWNVATVPAAQNGTSLFAGSNMGIWHSTDNVASSLELLEFLSEPETQVRWYEINGELPATTAGLADPALSEDPLVAVYGEQLADAQALPLVPNWDGGVGSDLLTALNSIVLNDVAKADAVAELINATEGAAVQ